MKKFFTIALALIAALMLTACSGKSLDDLIEVPDQDNTADSSDTSDNDDTDQGGNTNTEPTESTEPTEPTEPTESTDPTEPTEPTEPTDDSEPGDDSEPTDDSEPGDDSEPTDDSEPGDDSEPTDDSEPGDDSEPTDDSEPGDDTEPTDDSDSGDDSEPADDSEPGDDSEPTDDSEPGDDTEPTDDSEPGDDSEPTDDSEPGDDSEPTDDSDSDTPETQERCTEITLNAGLSHVKSSSSLSYRSDIFKTTYTPNTGSATSDTFYLKLYGSEYNYYGSHDLAGTNWKDDDGYSSGVFLYVHEDEYCDGKTYFQKAGSVNVTDIQINFGTVDALYANLSGVVLEEVTINSIGVSTPVDNGACLKINDISFEYHNY